MLSAVLLAILVWGGFRGKEIIIPRGGLFFSTLLLVVSFAVSALWAVDRGMALLGFVKFLPLPLFVLLTAQPDGRETDALSLLPPLGAGMTVLSFVLGRIPALTSYFFVNHRLSGFFQYPNTFALFLLLGVAYLLTKEKLAVLSLTELGVLLAGIALSGSRTTFVLLIGTMLYSIAAADKRKRRLLLSVFGIFVVVVVLYVVVTGDVSSVGRYVTTSLHSSTLLGRILYARDALPIIAAHPLGLGYLGYYFTQGSFQTGVYSVMNIHNELLQILLDVGWLPAIVCVGAVIVYWKKCGRDERLPVTLILLHSLFDFDLQFIVIDFVLLLLLQHGGGKSLHPPKLVAAAALPAALLCIYVGTASFAFFIGNFDAATAIYPNYTLAWLQSLPQAETAEKMESVADHILAQNESVSLAYSAKARVAYASGDIAGMIENKQKALSLSKYQMEEYLDYFYMLEDCRERYAAAGDAKSAEICRRYLLEIPELLDAVSQGTSALAWQIADKPELTLPTAYQKVLDSIRN